MGPPTEELAGARQDVDLDEGAQGLVASSGRAAAPRPSHAHPRGVGQLANLVIRPGPHQPGRLPRGPVADRVASLDGGRRQGGRGVVADRDQLARAASRAEAFFAAASWASALWRRVSEKAAEAAAKASRRASVEAAPRTRASSAMWARLASG